MGDGANPCGPVEREAVVRDKGGQAPGPISPRPFDGERTAQRPPPGGYFTAPAMSPRMKYFWNRM